MNTTVTPLTIQEAYAGLVRIANSGRQFRWNEVYWATDTTTEEEAAAIIGTGYDFTRTTQVLDVAADKTENTVEGIIAFRVIAKEDTKTGSRSLFLRTRLTWTRHNGVEHQSYAGYDISPDALRTLMAKAAAVRVEPELNLPNPETATEEETQEVMEQIGELLTDASIKATSYKAEWIQTPSTDEMFTEVQQMGDITSYEDIPHVKAVSSARKAEPLLLCMLSDMDMGEVEVGELPKLLEWVTAQPEITAAA